MNQSSKKFDLKLSPITGPLRIVAVGAGHRTNLYADYALKHPERMKIVAVVDPLKRKRDVTATKHSVPQEACFESVEKFLACGFKADAAINGTMDHQHHETTKPLIEAGLHVLLEKPIAPTEAQVKDLIATAEKHGKLVMICHVLRYAPFYAAIKRAITAGTLGKIMSIHTTEAVSYHHMATAFVRGRWNRTDTSNPMMMSKCCHDLDLLAWFMAGHKAKHVTSVGALSFFNEENAPAGSSARCTVGCSIERTCDYSAKRLYVEGTVGFGYPFEMHDKPLTDEEKIESLSSEDNMYGRCVWRCDNTVVDHQSILIKFDNETTVTHDMVTNSARPTRDIHIIGTKAELQGDMESGVFKLRRFEPTSEKAYTEEIVDVKLTGGAGQGGHGGGDGSLIGDFVSILRGEKDGSESTRIQDSLVGHQIAFAADESMNSGQSVIVK